MLGLLGYAARRAVDDARAEPAADRDLLGDRRRPRRVAAAAVDAGSGARQLPGRHAAKAYALVGAAAAIAAAVGPLLGGLITTYLSWRIAFLGEAVIIGIVLVGTRRIVEAPYTGPREIDVVGGILSALGMGGLVLGILVWEDGGGAVVALIAVGFVASARLAWWLRKPQA